MLGTALGSAEDPRFHVLVCNALQKCIATAAGDAAATAAIARFGKNFIPLLFNAALATGATTSHQEEDGRPKEHQDQQYLYLTVEVRRGG